MSDTGKHERTTGPIEADPDPDHREPIETVQSSFEAEPASERDVAKARSEIEDVLDGSDRPQKAAHDPIDPADPTDPTEPGPRP